MNDNLSNKELNLSNIAILIQSKQHYKLGCIIIKRKIVVNFNDKSRINGKILMFHAEINNS